MQRLFTQRTCLRTWQSSSATACCTPWSGMGSPPSTFSMVRPVKLRALAERAVHKLWQLPVYVAARHMCQLK